MRRRGRPPTRRAPEAVVPPPEEYVDEYAYVPPPTVQSDPMPPQTGPPPPPEVVGGQISLEQMAQLLATALRQPREPVASIEGAKARGMELRWIGRPGKGFVMVRGK